MSFIKQGLKYVNHIGRVGTKQAFSELRQTRIMRPSGVFMGQDKFGNKYFEDPTVDVGRDRWIIYNTSNGNDATTIPPEWHQWVHNISDELPESVAKEAPFFAAEHTPNATGHVYQSDADKSYLPHNFLRSQTFGNNYTAKDKSAFEEWSPDRKE